MPTTGCAGSTWRALMEAIANSSVEPGDDLLGLQPLRPHVRRRRDENASIGKPPTWLCDLGPADRVKIECACGQCFPLLTATMLGTAGVPQDAKLLDVIRPIKCQSCRSRGRAVVSVEWGRWVTIRPISRFRR